MLYVSILMLANKNHSLVAAYRLCLVGWFLHLTHVVTGRWEGSNKTHISNDRLHQGIQRFMLGKCTGNEKVRWKDCVVLCFLPFAMWQYLI